MKAQGSGCVTILPVHSVILISTHSLIKLELVPILIKYLSHVLPWACILRVPPADIETYSELATGDDLESGPLQTANPSSVFLKRPITTIIVPIYRRDCHNEVYAGSHAYPGEGTYLLKFDNSYSLWRSKTLYYRVFYTR